MSEEKILDKKVIVSFKVSPRIKRLLDEIAEDMGISRSELLRSCIVNIIVNQHKKRPKVN